MNKLKRLQRRLAKTGGMAAAAVIAAIVLMVLTGMFSDSEAKKKTAANAKLTQTRGQLANLQNQLDKSGDAEKRFIVIQQGRPSTDFTANSDSMKEILRTAKDHYRFGDSFKLELAPEKISDKAELTGLNFDVIVRDPMKITFEAMSDLHVYAFLSMLQNDAPGFIRVTGFTIKRKEKLDLTPEALNQMASGASPMLVDATIQFNWIGVQPKKAASGDAANDGAKP